MCEITAKNFRAKLPEIIDAIESAKFISIDIEFSALNFNDRSHFDSIEQRYKKLRETVSKLTPMQIGVTFFQFSRDTNTFSAQVYTFYLIPRSFATFDTAFTCKSSAFEFLCAHGFDFNKFAYDGLSFINAQQEAQLRSMVDNENFYANFGCDDDFDFLLGEQGAIVAEWIAKAAIGDILHLKAVTKYASNFSAIYLLHTKLRQRFASNVRTFVDGDGFKVEKVDGARDQNRLRKELNDSLLDDALGFTTIFRLIAQSKKPIVGHNFLMDLLILIHHLHTPLPASYAKFKRTVRDVLPVIFDTKYVTFELKKQLEIATWPHGALQTFYEYFRNGPGRNLAANGPAIVTVPDMQQTYHDAGFDSYCTGYIFVRMAHIVAAKKYNVPSLTFTSTELLKHMEPFQNRVNVIQGSISHICLDGDDPASRRPPWYIIEKRRGRIDLTHINNLLSAYGSAQVRQLSATRALIAVDNFWSANSLINQLKGNPEYRIQQYSFIRHHTVTNRFLWGTAMLSGVLAMWYSYKAITK